MYLHFGKHSDQMFCLLSSVLEDGDSSWLWETRPWAETDLPLRQDAVQRRTAHCWVCHCHTGKCMCVCVSGYFSADTRRECCILILFLPSLVICAVFFLWLLCFWLFLDLISSSWITWKAHCIPLEIVLQKLLEFSQEGWENWKVTQELWQDQFALCHLLSELLCC